MADRTHLFWLVLSNAQFLLLNKNLEDSNCGHVRKFVTLSITFWTIYLYGLAQNCINRQVVGIPMGNCAPLVACLFLFCCERDFMLLFSDNNQAYVVEAFNSTSRYI